MTVKEWEKRIYLTLDRDQRRAINSFYEDMVLSKVKQGNKEEMTPEEGWLMAAFMAVDDYKKILNGENIK